ncbi:TPA: NAD-dependent malic enzyme [Candidatus Woesearchaeota archaeon]|nr:NAD-dependent malic enzyme [Candidatus Woesearchaeota archaeon]HIH31773.1 NAD-dependent malic enzyme [Candidatus Woesearchaeota archaeon]HIH54666.1 NAD-dependent malic enzyme [Candidatus Woesearchaeota archaeon]HIJ01553.1 NAD-dependent malic enzyme [Candidatus Woesearchaeota archaeon]HIJ13956.1 NAD-dependent malic enzyme [Candidatus Woesearchaeota archaeon]
MINKKLDYNALSLKLHEKHKGKISVKSKVPLKNKLDLSIAYTPGVAEPCRRIAANKEDVYKYTSKGNIVAVITDGTAVLGLGDLGPEASLPVMEGKVVLFKEFADIDAMPIAIASKNIDEIVKTVKLISPMLGGINLEDISAPRCFEIEERLKKELDIPVMHDDQHGTAIVVLAGMINALKLAGKKLSEIKIIINGVGAAGIAIAKLLLNYGAKNIIMVDTLGAIYDGRTENMNPMKLEIAKITNPNKECCDLVHVIKNADVFIGVSAPNTLTAEHVQSMNKKSIIFAMANPIPEIMPDIAKKAGAFIIATGRSDFPNQINNVLAFPGVFRGALDVRAREVNTEMKIAAAEALAGMIKKPTIDEIIPSPFDKGVASRVAEAVKKAARKTKVNRI